MKKPYSSVLTSALFVTFCLSLSQVALATPPGPPQSGNAPIDGALWLLGAAGAALGGHRAWRKSRKA